MLGFSRKIAAVTAVVALCISTSTVAANPPAAPAPVSASSPSVSPWLTLSAMSGSATAAAAAQGEYREGPGFPPLPVLAVLLATLGVAIYIAVSDDGDDDEPIITRPPLSPA